MKIGLIGYGNWGKNHARVLSELNVLSGVFDEKKENEDSELNFFDNLIEIKEKSDAIVIATPAETHFELAKKLIDKNHLLIEKPITLNLSDTKKIAKLSKKYSKKVMVGHQLHFHPAVLKMEEIVDSGELGEIKWIYSNRLNMGKLRVNENVLWSFAPHDISLMNGFAKSDLKSLIIQGTDLLGKNNEDATMTLLEYKNGIKGHIFASWFHPFKEQRFIIVGSKATISFSDSEPKDKLKIFNTTISSYPNISNHHETILQYEPSEPLNNQLKYFIDTINHDRDNYINSIDHAIKVMKVLETGSKVLKKSRKN